MLKIKTAIFAAKNINLKSNANVIDNGGCR